MSKQNGNKGRRFDRAFKEEAVRFWAYRQDKGKDLGIWLNRVEAFALEQNRRFPIPLEVNDVCSTAYSISTWTWSGGGPLDHSPATQRRRGVKSGKVRRRAVADRDRAIVAGVLSGEPMRAVAREYGLALSVIQHIVARDASLFKPKRGRPRKIIDLRT